MSDIYTDVATLQSQMASVQQAISGLQTTTGAHTTSINAINSNVSDLDTDVASMQTSVSAMSSTVSGLNSSVSTLGNEVSDLSDDVSAAQTSVTNLSTAVSGMSTTVNALGVTVGNVNDAVADLEDDVSSLGSTVGGHTSSIGSIQNEVNGVKTSLGTVQTAVSALGSDVDAVETSVASQAASISGIQSLIDNGLAEPLSNGTNLNNLTVGKYFSATTSVASTLVNKPISDNYTALVTVDKMGNGGQLIQHYYPCLKDSGKYYKRVFYGGSWGLWETCCTEPEDTGWQNLTLATGWNSQYASDAAQYRKIGNVVYLRGLVSATAAAGIDIATLPVGCRPAVGYFNRWCSTMNQTEHANIQIAVNGVIKDHTKNQAVRTFISLSGIEFVTD